MSADESSADGGPALAVVTGEQAPELTDDGKRVAEWFESRGVAVDAVRWDRPVDWRTYDLALVRSCYEYPTDPDRFRELLAAMERADVTVCNPPSVLRWNMHKSYVTDLAAEGVPVPETVVVERDAGMTLASELERLGLDEAIVQPAIGTGSEGSSRYGPPMPASSRTASATWSPTATRSSRRTARTSRRTNGRSRSSAASTATPGTARRPPTTSRGLRAMTTATSP